MGTVGDGGHAPLKRDAKTGRWECRVYAGVDAVTGRVCRPMRTFDASLSEGEAQAAADEWARVAVPLKGTAPTLPGMLAAYVDGREAMGCPAQTVKAYRSALSRVARVAASVRFNEVDRMRARSIVQAVARLDGGKSAATVNQTRALLHVSYAQWVADGLVASNPFDGAPCAQRRDAARARALTMGELGALQGALRAAWDAREARPWAVVAASRAAALSLATGMRIGEACALRRDDVGGGVVRVHATSVMGGRYQPKPKTFSGERVIPLGEDDAAMLRAWLEWEAGKVRPGKGGRAPWVFCAPDGRMLGDAAVRRGFNALRDAAGLRGAATFHTLRHTFASHLLAAGTNPKVVQELLGHADVKHTLSLYGHVLPGEKGAAVDAWARMRNAPR